MKVMTTEDMVAEITSELINEIEEFAIEGNRAELEARLHDWKYDELRSILDMSRDEPFEFEAVRDEYQSRFAVEVADEDAVPAEPAKTPEEHHDGNCALGGLSFDVGVFALKSTLLRVLSTACPAARVYAETVRADIEEVTSADGADVLLLQVVVDWPKYEWRVLVEAWPLRPLVSIYTAGVRVDTLILTRSEFFMGCISTSNQTVRDYVEDLRTALNRALADMPEDCRPEVNLDAVAT